MTLQDSENWIFPFGKHKGRKLADIPDTYLDWVVGQDWFVSQPRNREWIEAIGKELALRKRSHAPVRDEWDKSLED
jgi:hypothetical protein